MEFIYRSIKSSHPLAARHTVLLLQDLTPLSPCSSSAEMSLQTFRTCSLPVTQPRVEVTKLLQFLLWGGGVEGSHQRCSGVNCCSYFDILFFGGGESHQQCSGIIPSRAQGTPRLCKGSNSGQPRARQVPSPLCSLSDCCSAFQTALPL